MSGVWRPGIEFDIAGTPGGLPQLVRDVALVGVTLLSLVLTRRDIRAANKFSWAPMQEVAKLFAGIFITMVPVLAMLKAGEAGAFSAVARAVTTPTAHRCRGPTSGSAGCSARSWTTRRPTWCSSTSPAATRKS
jgi:hypothetical protein